MPTVNTVRDACCSRVALIILAGFAMQPDAIAQIPFTGAVDIAAAANHTCALKQDGRAYCWGEGAYGKLGDGTVQSRRLASDPVVVDASLVDVSTTGPFACALTDADSVMCWGFNLYGSLGNGTENSSAVPIEVAGLSGQVKAVSSGVYHTCVVSTAGGVKCWGANHSGQIGDGTNTHRSTPVDVQGAGAGVKAIAAGESHTCALTSAGTVKCWGRGDLGQLGNGRSLHSSVPVDVANLTEVVAIAAGHNHTCAIDTAKVLKCWGRNDIGSLGDGTNLHRNLPVSVDGLEAQALDVSAGDNHTCALLTHGTVKCWGSNGHGQLGNGTVESSLSAVSIADPSATFVSIEAGMYYTCALTSDSRIKCWGDNSAGQLGDASVRDRSTAVDVLLDPPPEITFPVAVDDVFAKADGFVIQGNVLGNDAYAASDRLTATRVSGPLHGSVVLQSDGRFEYRPDALFSGEDGFAYSAANSVGNADEGEVRLQVSVANAERSVVNSSVSLTGMAAMPNGELVVSTSGNRVYRLLPTLSVKHALEIGDPMLGSTALLANGDAYLAGSDAFLYAFKSSGVSIDHWPRALGSKVSEGMSVHSDGTVFVCPENGIVQVISSANRLKASHSLGSPCATAPLLLPQMDLAVAVTTGGEGVVFSISDFVDDGLSIVRRFFMASPPATSLSAMDASRFTWVGDNRVLRMLDAANDAYERSSLEQIGFDATGVVLTLQDGSVIVSGNGNAAGHVCRYSELLAPMWCTELDDIIVGSGTLARPGEAFFALGNGTLVQVDIASGHVGGSVQVASASSAAVVTSSPLFDGRFLLTGDSSGTISRVPVEYFDALALIRTPVTKALSSRGYWAGAMGGQMRNGRAQALQQHVLVIFSDGFDAH